MTEQSLAALAGHDEEATHALNLLLEAYRREGLSGIRRNLAALDLTGPELDALVIETVFRLAFATSRSMAARRDWAQFDVDEAAGERDEIEKGGNA